MQQQQLYLQHYLYSSSNIRNVTQCSSSSYTYSVTYTYSTAYIAAVTSCSSSYTYSVTYTYSITYIAAVTSAMLLNAAAAVILTALLI